jgi:hypothetical protein
VLSRLPDWRRYSHRTRRICNPALHVFVGVFLAQTLVYDKCKEARELPPYDAYTHDNCGGKSHDADLYEWSGPGGASNCMWKGKNPSYADAGTGDTGGPPPSSLDPSREIFCVAQGDCQISTALAVAFQEELYELANEQNSYGEFVSDGLQLKNVDTDDVVYLLGFRTNDVVLNVNAYGLRSLAEVETAMLALLDETEFTVSLKRPNWTHGGWNNLTYEYEVQ